MNNVIKNFRDSLSPEIKAEFDLKEKERQEIIASFKELLKANENHEEAIEKLKRAIQSAAEDPVMTPEVKEIAQSLVTLIDYRIPFQYNLESIFEPVIDHGKSEVGRHAGSFSKKPGGKEAAEKLWFAWSDNPSLFKNKTKFCTALVSKDHNCCDSMTTADNWINEFREKYPNDVLEKILPPIKEK